MIKQPNNTQTEFHQLYKTRIHKSGIRQPAVEYLVLCRKQLNELHRDDQSNGEHPAQGWVKYKATQL